MLALTNPLKYKVNVTMSNSAKLVSVLCNDQVVLNKLVGVFDGLILYKDPIKI